MGDVPLEMTKCRQLVWRHFFAGCVAGMKTKSWVSPDCATGREMPLILLSPFCCLFQQTSHDRQQNRDSRISAKWSHWSARLCGIFRRHTHMPRQFHGRFFLVFFTAFFLAGGSSMCGKVTSVPRSMPKMAERSAPARSPDSEVRSVMAASLALARSSV